MKKTVFPTTFPMAKDISVFVNDVEQDVLITDAGYFVCAKYELVAKIEVKTINKDIDIHPLSEKIHCLKTAEGFEFNLNKNLNLYIKTGDIQLFFYGNKTEVPNTDATYYFPGGQIYEVGEIVLKSNESVYIERGAVVKGRITAVSAENINIGGQGVLDNEYYKFYGMSTKSIYLTDCNNVYIEGIVMIHPQTWMVVLGGCTNVKIKNIKELGEVIGSDGIDIVGSNHILIEDCMLRNNDDCIVIKYTDMEADNTHMFSYLKPVYDVLVKSCTLFNAGGGNALEIGHELRCDEIKDIIFRDICIIRVDVLGAAFSIHAGDQAIVKNILYENIIVEHYYDKLIDFRIIKSQFNVSEKRGQIKNITLKDIFVTKIPCNYGYSISLIGGFDDEHIVEGVHLKNFILGEQKILNGDMLDLHTKNAYDITYE